MKIKFKTGLITIAEIQIRARKDRDGNMSEYAVLSGYHFDRFSEFSLREKLNGKPVPGKKITFMCFYRPLWQIIELNHQYMLKGFVSFGYGNTFLVVEEAVTAHGEVLPGLMDEEPIIV